MGEPKFPKKKYNTPLHPWKEERIKSEREFIKKYGLKNHKEVWKAKTYLEKYRQQARELLAKAGTKDPQIKKESDQVLLHLTRMGILPVGSSLEDVLALETESVLSRRLQTLVYVKGLSSTANQSRQLINHGHIAIGSKKVTIPGYMVNKDEETDIGYTNRSPLNEVSHPARPKSDFFKSGALSKIKTEVVIEDDKKSESKEEKGKKEKTDDEKQEEQKVEKTKEETKKEDKPPKEEKIPDKKEPEQKLDEKSEENKKEPNQKQEPEKAETEKPKEEDKKEGEN